MRQNNEISDFPPKNHTFVSFYFPSNIASCLGVLETELFRRDTVSSMINAISIANYRCFHKSEFEGFRLINLIGGKNNVGKTALLEAVYVLNMGWIATNDILLLREEHYHESEIRATPWLGLFYQRKAEPKISITSGNIGVSIDGKVENRGINQNLPVTIRMDKGLDATVTPTSSQTTFIPSRSTAPTNKSLVELYSRLRTTDKDSLQTLLEGFQIIDKRVVLSEILMDYEFPVLHLQRQGEIPYPIKSFGDAMNRLAEYIMRIVSKPDSTLLIDEVENGIHYSTQQKIWEVIFTLAIKHRVQIFATTHSLEMIRAFERVAQQHPEEAVYVEMYRSKRTEEIAANFIDIESLSYQLRQAEPAEIRGEQ